jgi:hypothetical protein
MKAESVLRCSRHSDVDSAFRVLWLRRLFLQRDVGRGCAWRRVWVIVLW